PRSTPFPYRTLFRSRPECHADTELARALAHHGRHSAEQTDSRESNGGACKKGEQQRVQPWLRQRPLEERRERTSARQRDAGGGLDRKSTRLNSRHGW